MRDILRPSPESTNSDPFLHNHRPIVGGELGRKRGHPPQTPTPAANTTTREAVLDARSVAGTPLIDEMIRLPIGSRDEKRESRHIPTAFLLSGGHCTGQRWREAVVGVGTVTPSPTRAGEKASSPARSTMPERGLRRTRRNSTSWWKAATAR